MNPLPSALCSHQSTDTALSQLINGMTSMYPDNLILLIDLTLAGPPSAASSSSLGALAQGLSSVYSFPGFSFKASNTIQMPMNSKFVSAGSTSSLNPRLIYPIA